MAARPVVTCFLRRGARVLLLLRSAAVRTYAGRWAAVSGSIEAGEAPAAAACREVAEETGLTVAAPVASGEAFTVDDAALDRSFLVHPYLFDAPEGEPVLDAESLRAEWAHPPEILRRETVPLLWESWRRVAPTVEAIAADREHGAAWLSLRALEVLRDAAAGGDLETRALRRLARDLRAAQPAMGVVAVRVDRLMTAWSARLSAAPAGHDPEATAADALVDASCAELDRAAVAEQEAAARALPLVAGRRVATLSRSATVRAALCAARPAPVAVLVAESLPGGEGRALAEELRAAGLAVELLTDAELAAALAAGGADLLLVGADAVLADGSVVNKVGTRAAAEAARAGGLPCVAVAAADKVAPQGFAPGGVAAAGGAPGAGALFEVTPPPWNALVTELGVLDATRVARLAAAHARDQGWLAATG